MEMFLRLRFVLTPNSYLSGRQTVNFPRELEISDNFELATSASMVVVHYAGVGI